VRFMGNAFQKPYRFNFKSTGVLTMKEEQAAFPTNKTYLGNEISAERRREVRQEIDYCNAIAELDASINFAIDQSPLRKDGESIQYVLERIWSNYQYLLIPDISFEDTDNIA